MEDIYPSEYDIIFSKIVVLFGEEKTVQTRINSNTHDIKTDFKETLEKKMNVNLPEHVIMEKINERLGENILQDSDKKQKDSEENTTEISDDDSEELEISDEGEEIEISDIAKKIFKQIALFTHPDKIHDNDLNKLFVISSKEYKKNNVLELLFILSKCSNISILTREETFEINEIIDERFEALKTKKKTITYKWDNLNNIIKNTLLDKLYNINKDKLNML
jgi:hypothetical protein